MAQRDLVKPLGISLDTKNNILSDIFYFKTLFAPRVLHSLTMQKTLSNVNLFFRKYKNDFV